MLKSVLLATLLLVHWDGPAPSAALHAWFDSLASGKGLCCSFADGRSVADVDWQATGDPAVPYRVRVDGQWLPVPQDAVVTVPNKFGEPVVWPVQPDDGSPEWIRCFLPGAGA